VGIETLGELIIMSEQQPDKAREYLPKLLEYIELVNKIPPLADLPSREHAYHLALERNGLQFTDSIHTSEIVKSYKLELRGFPTDLTKYVFSGNDLNEIEKRVELLASLHHGLRTWAYSVTQEILDGEHIDYTFDSIEELSPRSLPTLPVKLTADANGILKLRSTEFFDLISRHQIEARRIRECVTCSNVFWARRKDAITCSQACGNANRQRLWHFRNKEEHNAQRRKNYAYKKRALGRAKN